MSEKTKVFSTLGSSNHATTKREKDDFYKTDPIAVHGLFSVIQSELLTPKIWECACGDGALSAEMEKMNYSVISTDLVNRGYGTHGVDFLQYPKKGLMSVNIVTNPPFKHAEEFVRKAMDLVSDGMFVCMFLRTLFLEGKARKQLFEQYPPKYILVSSARINTFKPGHENSSSAMSFTWFIWQKGYKDETIVKWFDKADFNLIQ